MLPYVLRNTSYSLTDIPKSSCHQQLDLTQNEPELSMNLLSTTSLMNSQNLLRSLMFPQRIYIIWMRKDVSEVVGRKAVSVNMSIQKSSRPNTNNAAQILSLLQSSRLSVLMETPSNPVLSSQVHCSVPNGLTVTQKLCKDVFKVVFQVPD